MKLFYLLSSFVIESLSFAVLGKLIIKQNSLLISLLIVQMAQYTTRQQQIISFKAVVSEELTNLLYLRDWDPQDPSSADLDREGCK